MTEKIKLSKEQLKAKRIENLERARLLKKSGRPKGSKNKITEKKIINMLERLLEDKKTLTKVAEKNDISKDDLNKISNLIKTEQKPSRIELEKKFIENPEQDQTIKKEDEQKSFIDILFP